MDDGNRNHKINQDNKLSLSSLLPSDPYSLSIMDARAKALASTETTGERLTGDEINFIKFMIADHESYGIPYADILDIKPNSNLTRVPKSPDYFLGVSYWHGKLIAVIDLGYYFGIRRNGTCMTTPYIATIAHEKYVVGFAFDHVIGVDAYIESKLDKSIAANIKIAESYVYGIHNGETAILNIHAILTDITNAMQSEKGKRS